MKNQHQDVGNYYELKINWSFKKKFTKKSYRPSYIFFLFSLLLFLFCFSSHFFCFLSLFCHNPSSTTMSLTNLFHHLFVLFIKRNELMIFLEENLHIYNAGLTQRNEWGDSLNARSCEKYRVGINVNVNEDAWTKLISVTAPD